MMTPAELTREMRDTAANMPIHDKARQLMVAASLLIDRLDRQLAMALDLTETTLSINRALLGEMGKEANKENKSEAK